MTAAAATRIASLVTAAWSVFDGVVAESPAELRKGPRGGGRDRDKMVDHVLGAEASYARMIGLKLKQPEIGDIDAIDAQRLAIAAVLGARSDGSPVRPNGWTTRYAARRIAWHVLDHAWEMEDRAGAWSGLSAEGAKRPSAGKARLKAARSARRASAEAGPRRHELSRVARRDRRNC